MIQLMLANSTHSDPISRHLGATGNRLIRTRDLADHYAQPSNETARLVRKGRLLKIANGYFLSVPEHRRDGTWSPAVEDLALALGVADYGAEESALIGPSAARVLGSIPRALSSALLAVPVHRRPLETRFGRIVFSARDAQRLTFSGTRGSSQPDSAPRPSKPFSTWPQTRRSAEFPSIWQPRREPHCCPCVIWRRWIGLAGPNASAGVWRSFCPKRKISADAPTGRSFEVQRSIRSF